MEKITFEDLPSTNTPINSTNLNLIQINTENAINEVSGDLNNLKTNNKDNLVSAINENYDKINSQLYYNVMVCEPITTGFLANQWNEIIYNYVTDTLSKGKYLLIFSFTFANGQEGSLTTTRLQIDGVELSPQTRATIPLTSKTLSGQIVTVIEFESDSAHTFNAQTYPSALLTGGCESANCRLIKLGE